jgi:hypothetical protein
MNRTCHLRAKLKIHAGLIGLVCLALPGALLAGTTYTYSGEAPTSFLITLNTTLTGAALDNIAPGTDMSSDLNSLTITGPDSPPSQDAAGFPIGGSLGSSYWTETPTTVQIGTNALGQITSWNIALSIFASYPAFPAENPSDFYCRYNTSSTTTADNVSLTQDNDAGLCPAGSNAQASSTGWAVQGAPPPATPEPMSAALLGTGFAGLWAMTRLLKRRKLSAR